MEMLVNPNVAYLIIMISILATLLAVLSPGTGILEAAALALLLLCGWLFITLPTNLWALLLIFIGFIPLIFAIRKKWHNAYLATTIMMILHGTAFLFKGEFWYPPVHPILLLIVSVLMGGGLWLIAKKMIEAHLVTPVQDLQKLIGMEGEARSHIHHEGSVYVNGELWSARSQKEINKGKMVKVIAREGLILLVEEI